MNHEHEANRNGLKAEPPAAENPAQSWVAGAKSETDHELKPTGSLAESAEASPLQEAENDPPWDLSVPVTQLPRSVDEPVVDRDEMEAELTDVSDSESDGEPLLDVLSTLSQAPSEWESSTEVWPSLPRRPKRKKALAKPELPRAPLTPEQKLLLLDTWKRSGLSAPDFSALVGISKHTLYAWKSRFEKLGPAGLMEQKRKKGAHNKLPDLTKRAILMMKEAHPEWGCQRISDMLTRGPALPASPGAVARVLHEAGYEMQEQVTRRHPDRVRSFERARPNQLWQTDLFSFTLKRQNRRVYLVAFMDDHSRFIVGYGLHASQSATLVIEVLRRSLTAYGPPSEILTDNGTQYVTWRGKSQFSKELDKRGVRQIVAKPRRPQTLGKIERFWGTLWRECLESAVFLDMEEARQRVGLFIDYYNFQRPHRGIDGLVPADRFFGAASEVLQTLKSRVAENALELARNGVPRQPFYLTGQVDGQPFSVHREGDRVILRKAGEHREEIELAEQRPAKTGDSPSPAELPVPLAPDGSPQTPWSPPDGELPPGVSRLDDEPASDVIDLGEQHD